MKLAKELDAATKAGQEMGLTEDEKAFYDALAANESAVVAMGDDKLKVVVKRILNRYGYPPDLQDEAVKTMVRKAQFLCADWA